MNNLLKPLKYLSSWQIKQHERHPLLAPLTQADRINVLILDDSIYHRARSKKVELLARLYDQLRKCA